MTIDTAMPIATLASLRELTRARTEYEERLGWPVRLDVEPRRLVLRTGQIIDAIEVPAALGRPALADLRITLLAGPVVADPTGAYWMFLTEPADRLHDCSDLELLDVRPVPPGSYVVVPPDLDDPSPWRWIERPRPHHALPPWAAVAGTLRRIGSRGLAA